MTIADKLSQTTSQNPSPALDLVRVNGNNAVSDIIAAILNRPAWNVSTAAVAPPLCATGSTTSKVKTTNTTQMYVNGVVLSLTGTDNLWVLTGGNLAAGSVRKYLLLWDGTTATTVVSVLQCLADQTIAGSLLGTSASALAACRFGPIPTTTQGPQAVVGILSIVNLTNAFVPGTTLLGATGVTATYQDGYDQTVFQGSIITP